VDGFTVKGGRIYGERWTDLTGMSTYEYGMKKNALKMDYIMSKKPPVIVQSNRLIEARYSLTVGEQRLILAMVSMIHPDDADFFDYDISIKDFSVLLNIDRTNAYREIEKISARIMGRLLHIQESSGWLRIGWISSCRYNHTKGSISLSFDPKLKPYLLYLKSEFTKCSLAIITQFQSIYSIRIYQLLKQYKGIGYREFRIEELKEILGIKKEQYKAFRDFNKRVLNQAKKEFEKKDKSGNCQCDLTFKLETIREGRKIARLKFIIIEQQYQKKAVVPPVDQPKKEPGQPAPPQTVKEQLVYYGISKKQADEFLKQMQEADIQDILKYYSDLLNSGQVKNTGGAYLAKLLRDGVTVKSSFEKEQEATRSIQQQQKELKRQQQELAKKKTAADQQKRKLQLQEKFDSLPDVEREQLLIEFEQTLDTDKLMLDFYRKDGVESVVVRATFYNFLNEINILKL
jgi:plasmid replication initiation protein